MLVTIEKQDIEDAIYASRKNSFLREMTPKKCVDPLDIVRGPRITNGIVRLIQRIGLYMLESGCRVAGESYYEAVQMEGRLMERKEEDWRKCSDYLPKL
ncbi:MAG: hypothetical protein ABL958_01560 [Bdellovibrionia bacterium]